ncbi:MAG: stage V sporulation protein AD [Acutalibacteraceae bacterium]|nr:stage V sporulation protein AD [Acutalibacteraceae bacterium]
MARRVGNQTILLEKDIAIKGCAGVVGKKEGEGPLSKYFDMIFEDEYLGQETFEAAESLLVKNAVTLGVKDAGLGMADIQLVVIGDLLDQSMASTYGIKDFGLPHIGLFGACSTCGLSLGLGSLLVESSVADNIVVATSSHFCTAERQFRFPLEYGSKRTPNSQRTVTGAGAAVLSQGNGKVKIKSVTFGKVKDYDVTDANNMGAAMAPAAADTIKAYLDDTGAKPDDFDLILTGDLGKIGKKLLIELLQKENVDISSVHDDCGLMIFDVNSKDFAAGGSGCGCSASVLYTYIMDKFEKGELKRILFVATGALLSPTSSNQGLSIPSIAHLVELCI